MAKKFWNSDKIVALTALFISLLTLIIFVWQTNLMERENHLSVMPYLMMDSANNSATQTFSISLENHGAGPAILERMTLWYKGQEYNTQFHEFLTSTFPQMDSVELLNTITIRPGYAIPVGGEINLLTAGGNTTGYITFLQIMERLSQDDFNYEIVYRSIYEDRWIITGDTDEPTEY